MPQILNTDKLLPGDILLYRDNSTLSVQIRTSANSKFSHAILYLGNHSFMEAITVGVTLFSSTRFYFPDSCELICMRLKDADKNVRENIAHAARVFCYRAFNMRGIHALRNGILYSNGEDKLDWPYPVFCTQFVGAAYRNAGVDLLENQPLRNFSPLHIEQSKMLIKVSDFLTEIPADKVSSYTNYESVDGDGNALLIKQAVIAQEVRKQLVDEYKQANLEPPVDLQEAINRLLTISEEAKIADKIISNNLIRSGFLSLWKDHEESNPELYHPFLLTEMLGANIIDEYTQKITQFDSLITSLAWAIDFQQKNLEASRLNYSISKFETHRLLTGMYENFVESLSRAQANCIFVRQSLQKLGDIRSGKFGF